MRKDAVQAGKRLEELGFAHHGDDAHGHRLYTHPDVPGQPVKLSMTPSDANAQVAALRTAHQLLGLPPPAAAGKRRPAAVRKAEQARARQRQRAQQPPMTRNDRLAHEAARRTEAARRVTATLEYDQELRQVTAEIRDLVATLRRCRTPAGRHAVAERIIPLVQRRDAMLAA